MKKLIFAILMMLAAGSSLADTIHVAETGSDTEGDGSVSDPYRSIKHALTLLSGLTDPVISVSAGDYPETAELVVAQKVTILGTAGAEATIVRRSGSHGDYRVFRVTHADAILDGLTIRDGLNKLATDAEGGGGLRMTAGTVRNCVVRNNQRNTDGVTSSPHAYGGGVYMTGGTLTNTVVRDNTLASAASRHCYGGGLYMTSGLLTKSTVQGNITVPGNSGHSYGGGITASGGTIRETRITGNEARGRPNGGSGGEAYGGGLYLTGSPNVLNCLITGNKAQRTHNPAAGSCYYERGAGVWMGGGTLYNCTVADNTGVRGTLGFPGNGAGVFQSGGTVRNSIVHFNTANSVADDFHFVGGTREYSCAPELLAGSGTGNLTADPRFVSREAPADYRLKADSICIDAGTELGSVTTDLEGTARPQDGNDDETARTDMGCYEFVPGGAFACTFNHSAVYGLGALEVSFSALVAGPEGSTHIEEYRWDFGDGTVQSGAGLDEVSHEFALGAYSVTLTVSNSLGQVTNAVKTDLVHVLSDVVYVSTNGAAVYPYNSWEKAASTPTVALMAVRDAVLKAGATAGTIWISNGVFDVSTELMLNAPIHLRSVNGPEAAVLRRNAAAGHLRIATLTHAGASLDGLTVRDGFNTLEGDTIGGGGVYMTAGTVRNSIIRNNVRDTQNVTGAPHARGGGVFMTGGLLTNCVVTSNRAGPGGHLRHSFGGGVYATGGTIRECRIDGNEARGRGNGAWGGEVYGGGLYFVTGIPQAINCLVVSNVVRRTLNAAGNGSTERGGGVCMSVGTLLNCTAADNIGYYGSLTAGGAGGGIHQSGGTVRNTIVAFNTSGGAANDFYLGGGTRDYSCAPELAAGTGTGNLTADPRFISRETPANYRLKGDSTCIDAGTDLASVTIDLEGTARPQDGNGDETARTDMGCYEFVPGAEFSCNFIYTPVFGLNTLEVEFTASVSGPEGSTTIQEYRWDFGDGTGQAGATLDTVSHLFTPGAYTVTLTVSNTLGQTATAVKVDLVRVLSDTVYVGTNGTAVYPYNSWGKATSSPNDALGAIKDAILQAGATAGSIWVGNGIFNVTAELILNEPIGIRSIDGPERTTLQRSGATQYRVFDLSHAGALVGGVTIRNGFSALDGDEQGGGGVRMTAGTVRDCIVESNTRQPGSNQGRGGGVYMTGGLLTNCVVRSNNARGGYFNHGYGGGVYASGASQIRDCRIANNTLQGFTDGSYGGDAYGGGLYMTGTPMVRNVLVTSNTVRRALNAQWAGTIERGGGIWVGGGSLVNATVADNAGYHGTLAAGGAGGGLFQAGGTVLNTIVWYNTSSNVVDNLHAVGGTCGYSCAPELTPDTADRNLNADPLFVGRSTLDYRLTTVSPCRNEGQNEAWMAAAFDLAGNPRIAFGAVDMGAFEDPTELGTLLILR